MLLAAVISAVIFWAIYIGLVRTLPFDPFFWNGVWKFVWVWVVNIVVSVVVHLIFSIFMATDYQISNWFQVTFQAVSSVCYAIFVIAGVYGWFLAMIPIAGGFDVYPWFTLLVAFLFLKMIAFCIAYPVAVAVARKMDLAVERLGDRLVRVAHRGAWGKEKKRPKDRETRERERA